MASDHHKSLTLKSSTKDVKHLKPFLGELQKWTGFKDEKFSEIRLALNEAVMNAISHGNKGDPTKKVYINADKRDQTIIISVKDEGAGFDTADLPDPTDEDNLLKPSGRGVFLIRQQADEVSISKENSTVTMKFNLE